MWTVGVRAAVIIPGPPTKLMIVSPPLLAQDKACLTNFHPSLPILDAMIFDGQSLARDSYVGFFQVTTFGGVGWWGLQIVKIGFLPGSLVSATHPPTQVPFEMQE